MERIGVLVPDPGPVMIKDSPDAVLVRLLQRRSRGPASARKSRRWHQEVFEEDLRGAGAQGTMLGFVGGLDVDGIGAGLLDVQNLDSLAVTTGDTIALAFGCLNDEVDASVVGELLVRGELLLL